MDREWEVNLVRAIREGNMVANQLAKKGALGNGSMLTWDTPPPRISSVLLADVMGLGFCRHQLFCIVFR